MLSLAKVKIKIRKKDIPKSKKKPVKDRKKPVKEDIETTSVPDAIREQLEKPMTTVFCPQSIKEKHLTDVKKYPDRYIEINIISNTRMVDNFYIKSDLKSFTYKKKRYYIDDKRIFLMPKKQGFLMLTCFYKEGSSKPKDFKKTNKGITSKALTLLYDEDLYAGLFPIDEKKYNFFIVVFSLLIFILNCIAYYMIFR